MLRRLARALGRLRWPFVVLAIVLLELAVVSNWVCVTIQVPVNANLYSVRTMSGGVSFDVWSRGQLRSAGWREAPGLSVTWLDQSLWLSDWGTFAWGPPTGAFGSLRTHALQFPLWTASSASALLALACFGLLRLAAARAGECKNCFYPLQSATTCPECGRVAMSSLA